MYTFPHVTLNGAFAVKNVLMDMHIVMQAFDNGTVLYGVLERVMGT